MAIKIPKIDQKSPVRQAGRSFFVFESWLEESDGACVPVSLDVTLLPFLSGDNFTTII
jgi:hypothetical protein